MEPGLAAEGTEMMLTSEGTVTDSLHNENKLAFITEGNTSVLLKDGNKIM